MDLIVVTHFDENVNNTKSTQRSLYVATYTMSTFPPIAITLRWASMNSP